MFGHVAHQPSKHSSREQQWIAIARALIVDPYLLIANEPTGNFVKCTTKAVKETLAEVRYGKTVLMITHNEELSVYADKVYRLRQGGWSGSLFFCPPCQSGWRSTNKGMATSSPLSAATKKKPPLLNLPRKGKTGRDTSDGGAYLVRSGRDPVLL